MTLNEEQYQRVGKYLDGEPITLTQEELSVVKEIEDGLVILDGISYPQVPRRAMVRAHKRMMGELARPRRKPVWVAGWTAALAAAVILLVVSVLRVMETGPLPKQRTAMLLPVDVVAEIYASEDTNIDIDLISSKLDELEADILASGPIFVIDSELDFLEQELDFFWMQDTDYLPEEI